MISHRVSASVNIPDMVDLYTQQKEQTLRSRIEWRQEDEIGPAFAEATIVASERLPPSSNSANGTESLKSRRCKGWSNRRRLRPRPTVARMRHKRRIAANAAAFSLSRKARRCFYQAASRLCPVVSPLAAEPCNPMALRRVSISIRAEMCDMIGRVPRVVSSRVSRAVNPRR
jgi:hypothetical protein